MDFMVVSINQVGQIGLPAVRLPTRPLHCAATNCTAKEKRIGKNTVGAVPKSPEVGVKRQANDPPPA